MPDLAPTTSYAASAERYEATLRLPGAALPLSRELHRLAGAVARACEAPLSLVLSARRGEAHVAEARAIVYLLAKRRLPHNVVRVGRELGRCHSTISHGAQSAERRELRRPAFAALVRRCEQQHDQVLRERELLDRCPTCGRLPADGSEEVRRP